MIMAAENIFDTLARSFRRIGCEMACKECVRPGEPVHDIGHFGDFGLCSRCRRATIGQDEAYFVDREESS